MVKSTCCACRGPDFRSWLQGGSRTSLDVKGTRHVHGAQTYIQANIHKMKINLWWKILSLTNYKAIKPMYLSQNQSSSSGWDLTPHTPASKCDTHDSVYMPSWSLKFAIVSRICTDHSTTVTSQAVWWVHDALNHRSVFLSPGPGHVPAAQATTDRL